MHCLFPIFIIIIDDNIRLFFSVLFTNVSMCNGIPNVPQKVMCYIIDILPFGLICIKPKETMVVNLITTSLMSNIILLTECGNRSIIPIKLSIIVSINFRILEQVSI